MPRLNGALVNQIVQSCFDVYEKLPKNGKPVEKEWTVMSCVVQLDGSPGVVALGTGSKCAGGGALRAAPALLADSHAEVCARRAFLLYLYDNIHLAAQNKPSIFKREGKMFVLEENIEFVFYSSQLPCGDASILPKDSDEELVGTLLQLGRRPAGEDICDIDCKKVKLAADIHRTGAKCLPGSVQDPKLPGPDYHRLGAVRTKPGRGDPTLSVSCSDKMARWIHVGIQGALLNMLCKSIHIKHFIFGGGVPYSLESLHRALLNRRQVSTTTLHSIPEFYQSTLTFPHVRTDSCIRPAPGSIIWTKTHKTTEVAVQGQKLGLTKKQAGLPKYSLCISKYKLYEKFLTILQYNEQIRIDICKDSSLNNIPYNEMKGRSLRYNEHWNKVKEKFFGSWTVKPDIWNFCVNMT